MKKILFVTTGFLKGGAEKQLYYLLSNIKNDFDIQVVSFFDGPYKEEIEKLGIKVHLCHINNYFGVFRAIYFFKKVVKSFDPDIIHSMLPHANVVSKVVTSLNFKKKYKLIVGVRNSSDGRLLNFLEKITDRSSDKIITNSYTSINALVNRGFSKEKIDVIYNGLDFNKPTEKYDFEKKIILTVAKFHNQKDYETNVKVVEELSKKRDDFCFYYIGKGPKFNDIKALVDQKDLNKYIKFLGERNDIPELMSSADLFFLPTKYEGQANVLLEAMYYGIPIVTTNIPENKEFCNAIYNEVGDVEGFSDSINNFLDGKIDFQYQVRHNKEKIKQFDINKMVENYKKIYDKF